MQQGANSRILSYKKPDRSATISLNAQDDGAIRVGLQVSQKEKKEPTASRKRRQRQA